MIMSTIFDHRTIIARPNSTSRPIRLPAVASWTDVPRKWLASYHRFRAFNSACAELKALDDRMLRDIGLDRSEITSALLDAGGERHPRSRFHNQLF
jgi:uncharacterized protein YjiS (DUF1127 family)